ncbi:MAG: sulfite exporter TauE/SafE family protein [Planctomycetota bacterium]
MIALVGAVLAASLVGSLHCAGMCGVFVAMACGLNTNDRKQHARLQSLYHGGRLIGYTTLGAIAGALGGALDLGASLAGFAHAAAIFAAAAMLIIGIGVLLQNHGVRLAKLRPPAPLQRLFQRGVKLADRLTPARRALMIGALTVLLPCGWLYAFAIVAASTAHPLSGALVMAAFWTGTVPILAALGAGVGFANARLGPKVRTIGAVAIVAFGAFLLFRVPGADFGFIDRLAGAGVAQAATSTDAVAQTKSAHCPLCDDNDALEDDDTENVP